MRTKYLWVVPMLALGACTTSLSTTSDRRTVSPSHATTGIPYSLPMTQFDLKVTRSITQCSTTGADGTNVPDVRFTVAVEGTPRSVMGETFLIDPQSLSSPTKTTSLSIATHDSGTLRSINATAQDRSAAIVSNIGSSVIGAVGLATGVPIQGLAGQGDDPPTMLVCAQGTAELLGIVNASSLSLNRALAALKTTTDRISFLNERLATGTLTDDEKTELTTKIAESRLQSTAVVGQRARLQTAINRVSLVTELRWPEAPDGRTFDVPAPAQDSAIMARFRDLLTLAIIDGTNNATDNAGLMRCGKQSLINPRGHAAQATRNSTMRDCIAERTKVRFEIASLYSRTDSAISDAPVDSAGAAEGVFYRPPERGRLIICRVEHDPNAADQPAPGCADESTRLYASEDLWFSQLGQLRFLPFRNAPFQNNSLSLTLRSDGTPEKIEYAELSSQLEGASGSLAAAIGQARTVQAMIRAGGDADDAEDLATLARDRAAALAAEKHQIDLLTLQNQLAALQNPTDNSDLTTIRAESELTNARLALLRAQIAEREASALLAAQSD